MTWSKPLIRFLTFFLEVSLWELINRVTPELRIFWGFPANPWGTNKLLLLKLCGIALIYYGKYISNTLVILLWLAVHREVKR